MIYAKESLETTSAGFGLLLASWGAGIVAGSILYRRRARHESPCGLILLSTAAIGLAYSGWRARRRSSVACLLSVLGGTGNGIQWVSVMTALQEATPTDLQARVVGLLESADAAMPGVGFLIGASSPTAASPRTAYAVAGAGTLLLVVVAARRAPRPPAQPPPLFAARAIMTPDSRRTSTARPMRARSRSRPASADSPR